MTDQTTTYTTPDELRATLRLDEAGVCNQAYLDTVNALFAELEQANEVDAGEYAEYATFTPSRWEVFAVRVATVAVSLGIVWATLLAFVS